MEGGFSPTESVVDREGPSSLESRDRTLAHGQSAGLQSSYAPYVGTSKKKLQKGFLLKELLELVFLLQSGTLVRMKNPKGTNG